MKDIIKIVLVFVIYIMAFGVLALAQDDQGKGGMTAMMDDDGDGKITKEEFVNHKEKMFSKLDENSDGVLDENEMKAMKMMCMKCGRSMMGKDGKMGGMMGCPEMQKMMKGRGMGNMSKGMQGMGTKTEQKEQTDN